MESFANEITGQALVERATELTRRGDFDAAESAWRQVLETTPNNLQGLLFMGARLLRAGQIEESIKLSERACELAPNLAAAHLNLGRARLEAGDDVLSLEHVERALALEPNSPIALLCHALALDRLGHREAAASALHTGLSTGNLEGALSNLETVPPNLRELVSRAASLSRTLRHDILVGCLDSLRAKYGRDELKRIEACVAIYLRERDPDYPDPLQHPTFLFVPGLPTQPFYTDHSSFPWLEELEAATDDVRSELIRVMREDGAQFHPVVTGFTGAPGEYWRKVNNSMSWNGFYFHRHGQRLDENCERCPKTAALLDRLPLVLEPGHSPEAHFSVLQPGAHIPIHTGVVNTRLVVHLPLIVPPDCGIRIAGETHGWREGKTLVFDDTFEHEAWNTSDTTRVVLILDTWNPHLTVAEREAFSTVVQTISRTPLLSIRRAP
jgi:aspartate beta-hydroxylase